MLQQRGSFERHYQIVFSPERESSRDVTRRFIRQHFISRKNNSLVQIRGQRRGEEVELLGKYPSGGEEFVGGVILLCR